MISLSQGNDRTLYFDFVPLNIGTLNEYTIRLHLYTVPGQIGYHQSRALISKGVDGVVFIADSRLEMMEQNLKSLTDLKQILEDNGQAWNELQIAYQYNKRDLTDAIPASELDHFINKEKTQSFETIATKNNGVYDVFKYISTTILKDLKV